jgi:hypothetical protein
VDWLIANVSVVTREEASRVAAALVSAKVLQPVNTSRFVDGADKIYRLGDPSLYRRRVQVVATPASATASSESDDINNNNNAINNQTGGSGLSVAANALFPADRSSEDDVNLVFFRVSMWFFSKQFFYFDNK